MKFLVLLASLFTAMVIAGSAFAQTPSPPATLPVVQDLRVGVEAVLFDANNFPLPPEKQIHTAVVTWTAIEGFSGEYEVERAVLNFRSGEPHVFERVAVIPPSVPPSVRFEERIDQSRQRCYRVRGVRGGATSPYSTEVCTPIPPSSGPGPTPTTTLAPPPDGSLPCPGMMNVLDDRFDTTLHLTGRAEVTAHAGPQDDPRQLPSDVVTLSWNLEPGAAKCIWMQRRNPGESGYTAMAIFVLSPDQTRRTDRPSGNAGEYCYRMFAVSDAGRSQPVESCVSIATPRRPVVFDGPGPLPPDAGSGRVEEPDDPLGWRTVVAGYLVVVAATVAWTRILLTLTRRRRQPW